MDIKSLFGIISEQNDKQVEQFDSTDKYRIKQDTNYNHWLPRNYAKEIIKSLRTIQMHDQNADS